MGKFRCVVWSVCLGLTFLMGASEAYAAKDVLIIDLVNEPATMDPHKQWNPDSYYVYRNIFDNMVARDTAGNIVPQVATSWKYESNTVVDFKIREDIKFHDGSPLTVEDVVFSVQRITNPAFKSPQLGQFDAIIKAEALDKNTVRLTTNVPYPVLLAQLVKLSIVPKAHVTKVGDDQFNQKPMGSGPYKFVEWAKGVKVVVEANSNYWRGKPPFPKVEFHAVPEPATRVANLRTGKTDLADRLDEDLAVQLKDDGRVKVLSVPTERIAYMRINTLYGPTKDIRVRKAIAYAINRDLIIDGLLAGYSKKTNVIGTSAHFGYIDSSSWYPFDPEKAKKLLAEAGLDKNQELDYPTAPEYDQRVVQALQQMLRTVGINAKIVMMDMPTYLKRLQSEPEKAGAFNFGRWSCACQDLDGVLFPLLRSGSLWSKFEEPEMDKELEAARSVLDPQERMKHYTRIHQIIEEKVPLIPIYQMAAIYGASKQLQWTPTANESMFIMDMAWKE